MWRQLTRVRFFDEAIRPAFLNVADQLGSLEDRRHSGPSWNRLSPSEESVVLEVALEQTGDIVKSGV